MVVGGGMNTHTHARTHARTSARTHAHTTTLTFSGPKSHKSVQHVVGKRFNIIKNSASQSQQNLGIEHCRPTSFPLCEQCAANMRILACGCLSVTVARYYGLLLSVSYGGRLLCVSFCLSVTMARYYGLLLSVSYGGLL